MPGHTSNVSCIAVTSGRRYIVSGSKDKTVRILGLQDKKQKVVLYGHTSEIISITINKDSKYIVSAGRDDGVKIWKLEGKLQDMFLALYY